MDSENRNRYCVQKVLEISNEKICNKLYRESLVYNRTKLQEIREMIHQSKIMASTNEKSTHTHTNMGTDLSYTEALIKLSSRECEVLVLYAEGNTASQIAGILHLSIRTVEKHLENIRAKLEIHGRGKLKAWLKKVYKSPSG